MDYWLPIIVLFGAFFFMLALGVPIVYAIGLSTLALSVLFLCYPQASPGQ